MEVLELCNKCGKRPRRRSGRECNECWAAYMQEHRAKNPEWTRNLARRHSREYRALAPIRERYRRRLARSPCKPSQ